MKNYLSQKSPAKIIFVILIVFVLLAGLILFTGSYYGQNRGRVAGETALTDPLKLAADYQQQFKQIFNNYLLLEDSANLLTDDYLAKTDSIKQNILALKVPAQLKDTHLQTVMALAEIAAGVKSQNLDLILPNIYKLRQIIDNF